MTDRSTDLYGSIPDNSRVALVLIDVINDMEFEDGPALLETALPAARAIAKLKQRARQAEIPVIYANDNFGRWRSDFNHTVAHCLEGGVRGEELARLLKPEQKDYFILKPKHSGFFETSLRILLEYLASRTLILAGFTGDICVMFTAKDAYMADYRLVIPSDCVASVAADQNIFALEYMQRVLKADVRPSQEIDLQELLET